MMSHTQSSSGDEAEAYTVYHKLTSLCSEIETEIKNTSKKSRDDVQAEIMRIRSEAFTQQSPEAEYATRLFRSYAEERTKDIKNDPDVISLTADLPPVLYEGHPDQIFGLAALKKNIFWMRLVVLLFSFLSFVIMACVPGIKFKNPGVAEVANVRRTT